IAAEARAAEGAPWATAHAREQLAQAALLRDIFGNPFKPVVLGEEWVTPTITRLAQAAYDARLLPEGALDPSHLAVLGDALEEAGCADAALPGPLRGPGPHARGCFALEAVLGKSWGAGEPQGGSGR